MNIYESAQDYLEKILMLEKTGKPVRSIDISRAMNVTRPSVYRIIKNLSNDNYIIVENLKIRLTEKGREIAEKMYERHITIANFLISLGVSEETAFHDSCKIEHDLSDESYSAIKALINKNS